jgi:hypothetical protein
LPNFTYRKRFKKVQRDKNKGEKKERIVSSTEIMAPPPIVQATLQSSLLAAVSNILAQAISAYKNNASFFFLLSSR